MRKRIQPREQLTQAQREQLIAFLRDWLPPEAQQAYREMIHTAPDSWWLHPHFQGGVILEYALRGNGFDEKALGVKSLEPLWPDLLRSAVEADTNRRKQNLG